MKKTYLKNSYAELRQEQIENFHKLNPTTLPPVYTKTPDETDDSDNPKAGFHLPPFDWSTSCCHVIGQSENQKSP